jgi:hypothetical protein
LKLNSKSYGLKHKKSAFSAINSDFLLDELLANPPLLTKSNSKLIKKLKKKYPKLSATVLKETILELSLILNN